MNRPYYSEYVRHALRFYTRNLSLTRFKSDADKNNWHACDSIIKNCPDIDREVLVAVYGGYDTLSDNVYETAKKYGINQALIWDLMKDVERKIAKRRGLM